MWTLLGILGGSIVAGLASRYNEVAVILGAILGGMLGYGFGRSRKAAASKPPADIEQQIARIYQALGDIHRRLAALEALRGLESRVDMPAAPEPTAEVPASLAAAAERAEAHAPSAPTPVTGSAQGERLEPVALAMASGVAAAPAEPGETGALPPRQPETTAPEAARGLLAWFTGGNAVVRIGLVILFFGVAFLVKYAAEHSLLPPELRLAGAGALALGLLGLGWKLRADKPSYGLSLQGGGVALLYLTIFGAFRLYQLLPATLAFGLLAVVAAASAVLAIRQQAQALAVLGVAGGFLAPVLASTGEGSHVALFSYYALLNAGIFYVAWSQSWRLLNFTGFLFTFVIATLWGVTHYRPEHFATTEPFLLLFFTFYLVIAVRYALREAYNLKSYVDATLVFGTPIVSFGLQSQLVRPYGFAAAYSALALAAIYLLLARWLWNKRGETLRLLVDAFVALGVVFATLALPLALDGRWTSAAWALEGAAVAWVSLRQERRLGLAFGVLLQLLAAVMYIASPFAADPGPPIANARCLGAAMIALAGMFTAFHLSRASARLTWLPRQAGGVLLCWGVAWWVVNGLVEIDRQLRQPHLAHALLVFAALTAVAFALLAKKTGWREARVPALAMPLALAFALLIDSVELAHPFAGWGAPAWILAGLAWAWCQRQGEAPSWPRLMTLLHAVAVWSLALVATLEVAWWIDLAVAGKASWPLIAHLLVPAALLAALSAPSFYQRWPGVTWPRCYRELIAGLTAAGLWGWMLLGNAAHTGDPWPLPFVPLLNPLDLAQAVALTLMVRWMRSLDAGRLREASEKLIYVAAFIWANAMLLRAMHFWGGVPYDFDAMMASMKVQTALALFWTLLSLTAMVLASRRGLRPLWFLGASLMALVVLKLFLVDLTNRGGVERIVSFIGVGLLLLALGYFSPLPPKRDAVAEPKS
ncbi:hypothetical protein BURK2_00325 [Burkholderiales bacterium]|nr:hypothetical protein BURK2_00325 [Burkholderiales bacterium]